MTLDSNIPLPELDLPGHRSAGTVDIRFSLVERHGLQPRPSEWFSPNAALRAGCG